MPDALSGVQLLRIDDTVIALFLSLTRILFISLPRRDLASSRIISRIPKINPLFLFSSECNPPSFFASSAVFLIRLDPL